MTRATLAHMLVVARNHPALCRVANWPDILSITDHTASAFHDYLAFTLLPNWISLLRTPPLL